MAWTKTAGKWMRDDGATVEKLTGPFGHRGIWQARDGYGKVYTTADGIATKFPTGKDGAVFVDSLPRSPEKTPLEQARELMTKHLGNFETAITEVFYVKNCGGNGRPSEFWARVHALLSMEQSRANRGFRRKI